MTGIDPEAAAVRRLVVKLLLELIDDGEPETPALEEIRDRGAETAISVLSDVADLAVNSLVQLHGEEEARLLLNRLIVADLEEEAYLAGQ